MYSMKRTSALCRVPYSTSGTISSSLTPRITTVSIFDDAEEPCGVLEPFDDARVSGEARECGEAAGVERVEADREPHEARRAKRLRLVGQQHAVGRQGEVGEQGVGGEQARRVRAGCGAAAARRPSAGPCPRRALWNTRDERADLLERQQVFARQPGVFGFRHAVLAAEVAPVGDRDAEAAQRPAEEIDHGHGSILPHAAAPAPAQDQRPGIAVPQRGQAPLAVSRFSRTANERRRTSVSRHDGQRVSSRSPTEPGRLPA